MACGFAVTSSLLVHSSLGSLARAIVLVPSVYLTRPHREAPVCFHQPSREKVSASILWGMAGAAGDHPWRGLVPRYHAPLVAPAWVRVQNVAPVVVDGWVGGAFSWSCSWRPVPTIHTCDWLDWLGPQRTGIMPFDLHCSPLFLLSSLRDLDRP